MTRIEFGELLLLVLLTATAAAAVPLTTGYMGLSWDALNHHIYLGLVAEQPRWHLDVMPASVQTYQYPYLYWPVYKLVIGTTNGAVAGAIWSALQALLVVPPLWWICRRLLHRPEAGVLVNAAERLIACVLALSSVVVWVALETTTNDLLAAVPLLWAIAIASHPHGSNTRAFWSAALLGISVAAKLSNGLFVPLLALWWLQPAEAGGVRLPLRRGMALGGGAAAGFALAYAPWGWQLWQLTGNPLYPFASWLFGG